MQRAAELARLLGDPLRLTMLQALMWGEAPVAELIAACGASQPNVSNHLRLLRDRGVVAARRDGRQMLYRVASPDIAELVSALCGAAGATVAPTALPATGALIEARTCYDHLAGRIGVRLLANLAVRGAIRSPALSWEDLEPGPEAGRIFQTLGIDIDATYRDHTRRRFAFACPDWSERDHYHLGGALGAVLCARCLAAGWMRRDAATRAIAVTPSGTRFLGGFLAPR